MFWWTYALMPVGMTVQWVRTALPTPGTLAEQPARLLYAIEHVHSIMAERLAEHLKTPAADRGKDRDDE